MNNSIEKPGNIFSDLPARLDEEFFETLIENKGFKLERIVSKGHATPEGQWYDQEKNEWVLLVSGSARLIVEGEPRPITLEPGDHLILPAHLKHRVEWTAPDTETVWLAVHY